MSSGYGKKRFVNQDILNRIVEGTDSTREKLRQLFGFQKKEAEEIVEEAYDVKNLTPDSLDAEVEKLRNKLEEGTSDSYSSDEAALLLYHHISDLMVEAKSEYERLSQRSDRKKRQRAEGKLTSMSYLLDIAREIRENYSIEEGSLEHQLLLLEDGQDAVAMADGGETRKEAGNRVREKIREIEEKNQMLRRYVDQQSSIQY